MREHAIEIFTVPHCAFTERVKLALEEAGLPYRTEIIDPKHPPEWFATISPKGETPVGKIDGVALKGSTPLLRAVDEISPRPRLGVVPGVPTTDIDAALAWTDEKYTAAHAMVFGQGSLAEQKAWRPQLSAAWAHIDAQLAKSGGPYWFGNAYSIVDVALTPFLNRLPQLQYYREFGPDPALSRLTTYANLLRSRPSFLRVAVPSAELTRALRPKASLGAPGVCSLLQHAIFRSAISSVAGKLKALQPAPTAAHIADAREEWDWLMEFLEQHARFEDMVFFPAMDTHEPGFSKRFMQEHHEDHHLTTKVTGAFNATASGADLSAATAALLGAFNEWTVSFDGHMEREEQAMGPLMKQHVPPEAQPAFMKKVMDTYTDDHFSKTLARSFTYLKPSERAQYANAFAGMYKAPEPQRWARLMNMVRSGLGPTAWADIEERVPDTSAALDGILTPATAMASVRYGYTRILRGVTYEAALEKVVPALKTEGFGIMTEIDVKETLHKKLNADFRKYRILGACNPNLALQVLQLEPGVGLFMPCNVIVFEDGADTVVSAAKAQEMFSVEDSQAVKNIGKIVDEKLKRALDTM